jgi:hypothetical protein
VSNAFFKDQSHLLGDNPARLNYGAAVVDIDGDGEFEVYVTGFGGACQVLKWTPDGFINIADMLLSNYGRRAIGVAACDIDHDGREEIYVLNTDTFAGAKQSAARLFKWHHGQWIDLFSLPENYHIHNLFAGRSVGCVDRFGTGEYGFFVANYGGPMRLYELIRNSLELIDAAPELGLNYVTGGRAVVAAPILSSRVDIFANNENGPNFLFRNEGDGTFTNVAMEVGLGDFYEHGRGTSLLDANGDGLLDIVYGNWEGQHRLYLQNPDGTFSDNTPDEMAFPSRVRTVIAADFDNDGYDEIFFNNIGEPNRLFGWRDNLWTQLPIGDAMEPDGMGTGAVVGDFGCTGQLKLLVSHGEAQPQPLSFYIPEANENHWLRVLPLTRYGAPARGAIVRLRAGGRLQSKVIDAGSGYLCQMEPVAHFGLSQLTKIDEAEIQWPDGSRTVIPSPEVNTRITVRHGDS